MNVEQLKDMIDQLNDEDFADIAGHVYAKLANKSKNEEMPAQTEAIEPVEEEEEMILEPPDSEEDPIFDISKIEKGYTIE